ncbi:TPA: Arc family DNA-binding protein [Aeromonas hydrophila]|nr:Arc family DNA-binding protein [Aeromonas hydrophila]HAU4975657.1 Arc family DNA-binding protein [Aeromonas hydrophila]HAU4984614.1 Arc family DNA-binding protein [Aeromonas hydrophila]
MMITIPSSRLRAFMSREHPQLRVRIPPELKDDLEAKAAESGRTLTAEIVNRLELSMMNQSQSSLLIDAKRAKELAELARRRLPKTILELAISEINRAISLGHEFAYVNLHDFELEFLEDDRYQEVTDIVVTELERAGYTAEFSDCESLRIEFK